MTGGPESHLDNHLSTVVACSDGVASLLASQSCSKDLGYGRPSSAKTRQPKSKFKFVQSVDAFPTVFELLAAKPSKQLTR